MTLHRNKIKTLLLTVILLAAFSLLLLFNVSASNEVWRIKQGNTVNLRQSATTSSKVIAKLYGGTKITVTQKKKAESYTWGKVSYSGSTGWCVLQYADHVSGSLNQTTAPKPTCKKPSAPTQATSGNGTTSIKLQWKKVSGANGYRVYMYDSQKKAYVAKGSTTSLSYTVTGLKAGTTYKFYLKAYINHSSGKIYSGSSATLSATTLPASPTSLTVTGITATSVSFKWKKVSGATLYTVYKYNTSTKKYVSLATTSGTSYTAKASKGEKCSFRVKAIKKLGSVLWYSGSSATLSVSALPAAPSLTAKASGTAASLSWKAVKGATDYEVSYATTKNGSYKILTILSKDKLSYKKTGLTKGKTYYFRVRAYNTTGSITGYSAYSAKKAVKIA